MATEKEHYWQFYLRPNALTKDDLDDCVAEVFTAPKTMRNEDIVRAIMQEGSEVSYETALSIVNKRDRIIRENLLDGHSVITEICQFTPRITGVFASSGAPFDPKVHGLTLDMVLVSGMREALKTVKTVSLGAKPDAANIELVTDTLTDLTDGSITPGEDIRIDGNRIKIAGPEGEETNGVFFVPTTGNPIPVTRRLTRNDPSCLIARVPMLTVGNYTLRIVTHFSQSSTLLKTPRVIEYKKLLTVVSDEDDRPDAI